MLLVAGTEGEQHSLDIKPTKKKVSIYSAQKAKRSAEQYTSVSHGPFHMPRLPLSLVLEAKAFPTCGFLLGMRLRTPQPYKFRV